MNNLHKHLEVSYTTIGWELNDLADSDSWDPGFDAERCLVISKLGPYRRLFEKPDRFVKRFYHTLRPLAIEHWTLTDRLELYDGFCTIDILLNIRFQATFKYIQKNDLIPENINAYIKSFYEVLVRDIVQDALLNLKDGVWVQTGLGELENEISLSVNELLLAHDIQALTLCQLKPFFKAFPDIKFKEESVYLMALKKNFELTSQKQQEQFQQEQMLESQRLEQKHKHLELIKRENELELLKQSHQAEYEKKLLLAQEAQQAEKFAIEKRLHAEKVKHETALHKLSLIENIQRQEQQESLQRQLELTTLDEKIAHQLAVKEQELAAKIKAFELEKTYWNNAKAQWHIEEIKYKQRQKQLEIDAEIENKAYLYQQQLKLQEQLKFEKHSFDGDNNVLTLNQKEQTDRL